MSRRGFDEPFERSFETRLFLFVISDVVTVRDASEVDIKEGRPVRVVSVEF